MSPHLKDRLLRRLPPSVGSTTGHSKKSQPATATMPRLTATKFLAPGSGSLKSNARSGSLIEPPTPSKRPHTQTLVSPVATPSAPMYAAIANDEADLEPFPEFTALEVLEDYLPITELEHCILHCNHEVCSRVIIADTYVCSCSPTPLSPPTSVPGSDIELSDSEIVRAYDATRGFDLTADIKINRADCLKFLYQLLNLMNKNPRMLMDLTDAMEEDLEEEASAAAFDAQRMFFVAMQKYFVDSFALHSQSSSTTVSSYSLVAATDFSRTISSNSLFMEWENYLLTVLVDWMEKHDQEGLPEVGASPPWLARKYVQEGGLPKLVFDFWGDVCWLLMRLLQTRSQDISSTD
jgi:hypothetical protein